MFTVQSLHISLELWGSIFSMIITICLMLTKGDHQARRKIMIWMALSNTVLLVMDALAWTFRGTPGVLGFWMVRISNGAVFILNHLMAILYHTYVCHRVFDQKQRYPASVYLGYGIETLGILMVVISQFTNFYYYFDSQNFYHRNTAYPLCMLLVLGGVFVDLYLLVKYRKHLSVTSFVSLVSYILLPVAAAVIQTFFYGISLINLSITISLVFMFMASIAEQSQILTRKEQEAYDMRTEILLSQIGPHFIYNTLSVIKHLCRTDPKLAAQTVDEFATYLRGNLDSLTEKKCIAFERELAHTKSYLAIEQKRFGDRIRVVYDIGETGFLLPALTLQPLVENAVKHGITKREQGGTITIRTALEKNGYRIEICDDGVGFVPEEILKDGHVHVGVINVKNRIEAMCHGSLEIQSALQKGTNVTIHIPSCI